MRFRFLALAATLAVSAPLLSACEDNGFLADVLLSTDTVTIGLPGGPLASALDLVRETGTSPLLRRPETLADAQSWDLALRRTEGGGLALRPYEATGTGLRGASIAIADRDYDRAEKAPRPIGAYSSATMPLSAGATYYVRTRQFTGFGVCHKFAKIKAVALDVAAGTATIAVVINENCDDERLTDD